MALKFVQLSRKFLQFAVKHRGKIMNANDPELLAESLGSALQNQRTILLDPSRDQLQTLSDILEVSAEVRVLTNMTARKLEIETKNKTQAEVLGAICDKLEAADAGGYASDIRDVMAWSEKFFSTPEVRAVLDKPLTELDVPTGIKDALFFPVHAAQRGVEEIARLNTLVAAAKKEGRRERDAARRADKPSKGTPPQPGKPGA